VKSQGKGKRGGAKQPTNTVSRINSVTHNSRHLKQIAKACSSVGRRDLQANALARYSKVHAALLNINKPVAAAASLRGKRGLGVAPGVFRVHLDISDKAKRIHKKHEAVRCTPRPRQSQRTITWTLLTTFCLQNIFMSLAFDLFLLIMPLHDLTVVFRLPPRHPSKRVVLDLQRYVGWVGSKFFGKCKPILMLPMFIATPG
jgi:hypothetical protein